MNRGSNFVIPWKIWALTRWTDRLKIFGPIAIVAFLVLLPVNATGGTLTFLRRDLVVNDIDKLSISNVHPKSYKFFVHTALEYLFTFWTCCMLFHSWESD